MLRKNILPEMFNESELTCAAKKGKFRSIISSNNIQVSGIVKRPPEQGTPNASFLVFVDAEAASCIKRIHQRLSTLISGNVKDPLYVPNLEDDGQPSAKRKKPQPSLRVKIKDASTIVQNPRLETVTSQNIQKDAQVICSLKADYLFDLGTEETITFTATRIVVKPGLEQMPTILKEGQPSHSLTQRICDTPNWLETLTHKEPNHAANRMVYMDWSETPKLQIEGENKFGIDFAHEFNQGRKIEYVLTCDEPTVEKLTKLDAKTALVVEKEKIFKKMKDVKHSSVVNLTRPQWPKVRLKYLRGKTTVHRMTNTGILEPGEETDLSTPGNSVIALVRPSSISCSKAKKSFGTQLVISNLIIRPSAFATEDFDERFLKALQN